MANASETETKTRAPAKNGKPPKLRVIGVTVDGVLEERPIGQFPIEERQYFRDLHSIVDDIFNEAKTVNDWNWNQLASAAGLSASTVGKLGDRLTKWPRFLTIYRLAKAVGWELKIQAPKKANRRAALKVG